jgi:hypothetical protein
MIIRSRKNPGSIPQNSQSILLSHEADNFRFKGFEVIAARRLESWEARKLSCIKAF